MAANGSPPPLFETDDERASFVIRLPVHPLALAATAEVTDQVTDQVTGEVAMEVAALFKAIDGEMPRRELQGQP